ncbi:hypothetical protein [Pedobacter jejuensis]|uniref:Uncharacterized protein n=1 Tax=Pedobacter jejuensis TaxID=1268550 RepID=A0A3N0BXU7_9SPHI|nr:hypothetical protein [Pedobacter jejuensis]RNL54155.1 hypothetical protein D7004_08655 [Pedobacter jejuensis]
MIILLLLYGLAIVVLFVTGIIMMIVSSSNNTSVKPGLKLLIASVIMVVIGLGACAVLLANG